MKHLRVDGHTDLVRDPNVGAISNINESEYQKYIFMKNAKENEEKKIQNLEHDVANIKNDLNEIKDLLRSLIK
jgi:hypothetical protein